MEKKSYVAPFVKYILGDDSGLLSGSVVDGKPEGDVPPITGGTGGTDDDLDFAKPGVFVDYHFSSVWDD